MPILSKIKSYLPASSRSLHAMYYELGQMHGQMGQMWAEVGLTRIWVSELKEALAGLDSRLMLTFWEGYRREGESADAAREGARLVPVERLMIETDSPYMTPEPMRGAACTPAHVVFTAARLAEIRGIAPGDDCKAFLEQIHANTVNFYAKADARGEAE